MNSLRYAVLHHTGVEKPHFDVMFESAPGSPLTTFRVDQWPVRAAQVATPLDDHRAIYLTYEGPISGNRGEVRRVAGGTCNVEREKQGWRIEFILQNEPSILLRLARDAMGRWSASPIIEAAE